MKKRLRMLLAAALSCAIILPGGTFFTQSAIASEPATSEIEAESIIAEDAAYAPGQAILRAETRVVEFLHVRRQAVGQHGLNALFATIGERGVVVPAFVLEHVAHAR